MTETIGRILNDRYQVISMIGRGGMAEVYKAWDQVRQVNLAMKILHADLAEDKIFLRRFRREAQTLSKLQHPNIVRFYGMEQDQDCTFLLMDYVEGTTLRKEIFKSKGPLSFERILEIIRPVCSALHYAHMSGFVHCDVKPANIMLHDNGTVLVSDFGISRMSESATATMVGAGTPAYMAPEQIRGQDPTPQTDIYALAIVLYEMLTGGERPFTGENAKTTGTTGEKVRWEQLNLAAPSPRQYNPDISSELEAVLLKALAKDPQERYTDMNAFWQALEECLVSTTQLEEPVKSKGRLKPVKTSQEPPKKQPAAEVKQPSRKKTTLPFSPSGRRSSAWPWVIGIGILAVLLVITILNLAGKEGALLPSTTATVSSTPTSTVILNQPPTNTPSPTIHPTNEPTSTPTITATITPTITLTPTPSLLYYIIQEDNFEASGSYNFSLEKDLKCTLSITGFTGSSIDFDITKSGINIVGLTYDIFYDPYRLVYTKVYSGVSYAADSLSPVEFITTELSDFTLNMYVAGYIRGNTVSGNSVLAPMKKVYVGAAVSCEHYAP